MPKSFRVAIVPNMSEPYDREVVRGISRFVHERGHWRLYLLTDPSHQLNQIRNWRGDGILANVDHPRWVDMYRRKRLPVIGFGGGAGVKGKGMYYIATDDQAIGRMGAAHLIDRGFKHFAYCAMSLAKINQPWSENRAKSFRKAVEEAGFDCHYYRDSATTSRDWEQLLAELGQWLRSLPKPVGLMAAYDWRALHVLEACRNCNISVPDEVAVIGVDNDEQICDLAIPPLTSIIQGGDRLGYEAAQMLDRLMNGKKPPDELQLAVPPVGVVTRQSTDVLAIADEIVATAIRYIREHACEGIQVIDVVDQVPVSRVSLETRFKEAIGRTMHEEIQRVRLERVKQLLRATDLPIRIIAERAGFRYSEYLSNLFRRETGQTPGAYRTAMRQTEG